MAANLAEARAHNVPPEVFLRHYRTIRDAKQAHADTGMAVARAKKAAKASGVDLDALKMLEKFADLDTDEAEMQIRHLQLYAKWIELPIGTQLGMFAAPTPPDPNPEATAAHREWTAGEAGMAEGKSGGLRTANTYPAGSAEHVAYDKAWTKGNKVWLKGQEKIAKEMGANAAASPPAGQVNGSSRARGPAPRAATPGRRRGRPRGNGAQASFS